MADTNKDSRSRDADRGVPGGGAGRQDRVEKSGVYPASAGNAPDDAEVRTQAAWGQGSRGAAGYEDSGPSELRFTEEQLEEARRQEAKEHSKQSPRSAECRDLDE